MSSSLPPPPPSEQSFSELLQKYCGDDVVPYKGGGVKLTDVNPHLVCVLCHGYFVDATSIVECLHSFCRSCIVLHLDKNNFCPICREDIQNSKALKPDKALQDIVYKLVPGLFHSEMKRRQEFYQKHPHRDMHLHPESRGVSVDRIIYTADESISLSLEYYDKECEQEMWKNVTDDKGLHYIIRAEKPPKCIVRKRYLKCPAAVRMSHLKKFIRLKYNLQSSDFVELLYRRESLPEEYSIMDIAYIYTWNRNEPMRFFYKINARVTVPVIPTAEKCLSALGDTEHRKSPNLQTAIETTPLPPQVKSIASPSPIDETVEEKENTAPKIITLPSVTEKSLTTTDREKQRSKTESILAVPTGAIKADAQTKKDRRSSPPLPVVVPMVPLNPPISPEGTSRKENVSDNVRNSCANDPEKQIPAVLMAMEEKKSIEPMEHQQTSTTVDVPIKKLEKLVDQKQQMPLITVTSTTATKFIVATSTTSALPLPKKSTSAGESKLNLSISKLIMKNQNAAAAAAASTTKFVPTLQQMQQIGMHTSIPTFQQQQLSSSPQPNAYVRPGFPGMHPFKRLPDVAPAKSQASTNRPPFIPVRNLFEWNKARNLAAKSVPSSAVKDGKSNDKSLPSSTTVERQTKKLPIVDKSPTITTTTNCLLAKNSDEMNAAQSLLKVGQDLRLSKSPIISDLHDKYNCESSLQITKVTEPETNQMPVTHETETNAQPSLQIMRVPTSVEKSTRPITTITETTGVNENSNSLPVMNKPVNKKPVPSLYSMPTKLRTKEDHNHNNSPGVDNKRIERRVDTENGVLSVSLLTETSKQDMDAKRREVVQPDVSIKLMTFATEPVKKTPELNHIGGNNSGGGGVNKRKHDELKPNGGGGSANKRKQDEPERKVTPPKPAPTKDDVPQLIEINSSPYAKLLPTKKQQPIPKQQHVSKQQPSPKQQPATKQSQIVSKQSQSAPKQLQTTPKQSQTTTKQPQTTSKQSPPISIQSQPKLQTGTTTANILDLSKSPPNGGVKRLTTTESPSFSPNKKKSSPVQYAPSTIAAATSAAINSNLLFAAQRQAAAFLLKQHFDTLNSELLRNGGKGPTEWPRAMFNPALFARPPPTNLNN